jgi:hypothetical protein
MLFLYPIWGPKDRGEELPGFIGMTSVEGFSSGFFIALNNLLNKLRHRAYPYLFRCREWGGGILAHMDRDKN